MAPNPKVANAFRAMRNLGIPEEKTKPVLKNLLKIYEKNWELIEEENYRALADAIFDSEEAEAAERKKKQDNAEAEEAEQKKKLDLLKVIEEETQIPEEPERPLKCLRLRNQETPLKKPKIEIDNLPFAIPKSQSRAENGTKEPVLADDTQPDVSESDSGLRLRHLRDKGKGKEPMEPQTSSREVRSVSDRPSSHGVRIKEPKPKETVLSLIKPKDEPLTNVPPLPVIRPEPTMNGDSPSKESNKDSNNKVAVSSNETNGHELAVVPDDSTSKINLASSSNGDIKISLTHNPSFPVTDVDTLLKKMEDKCLKSYKTLDENFSIKKLMTFMCDSLLEPEPTEPNNNINNENINNNKKDNNIDIAKGQESVIISLVNEVNTECPPSFHYIRGNAVFQNAYVNFSLARISDDNCCSTCFGDCLTSETACACALQSGGEFAYTKEGLVKEELLDECIKMNRDPQKHCLFYCKECPVEKAKNEEVVEACKGHSVRSFVKECWLKCGCDKQCGNRVVQRGIQRKLQVFMTPGGKGWGLRTLEELPKGAFVCEYVGEVLTNAELFERVSKSSNKDEHAYPVLLDADWGAESALKDEEALCLDATYYGNVARFINHRCFDSNMVEIPVEIENPDHHYYHLAFFTTRKVKALEELTWDYGIDFDDEEHPVKAFKCRCGSRFCRNIKRPFRSRKRRFT